MIQKIKIIDQLHAPFSLIPGDFDEELTIMWNIGEPVSVRLDDHSIEIDKNCIFFISEFYMNLEANASTFRMIRFSKTFINPFDFLANSGEYLMIFHGLHYINHLPKILLKENELDVFEEIWRNLLLEIKNLRNPISEALIRNSFERFLLISHKNHFETEFNIPINSKEFRLIRAFQYLVKVHFKTMTKVSDYANILDVSPKKISQVFGNSYTKKASQLIADQRNLYAKQQLIHTDDLVKNIAYDLNFSDPQAFSHFFKKQNGLAPEEYRIKSCIS